MIRILNAFGPELAKTNLMKGLVTCSGYHSGVVPIKMAYNSYESTNDKETSKLSPLIIMHGLFGSKSNWNSLSKSLHLKTKRKVIALDARNHGESPHTDEFSYAHLSTDIGLFVKELNLSKATLLGHSMGGRAVMHYALTNPDAVDKLIVVDISPTHASTQIHKMEVYFQALEKVKINNEVPMSEGRKEADRQLEPVVREASVRQFLLTNLVRTPAGFHWRVNLDSLSKAFQREISLFPEVKGSFERPTLFIGGLKSDYISPKEHGKILTLFPSATFEYLDAGHWVHAEKPAEFLSLVTEFLKN